MKILSNFSLPGDDNHEIVCFSGKFHDHFYYDQQQPCYFPDVLNAMPKNWEPDFVLFKSPQYFAVPYGIEQCPFPTVLLLDDWFGGVDYLLDIFTKFDSILTDKTSVVMLRRMGFDNVEYWPLFVASPAQFHVLPDEKRIYDVTFTGNFNVNVQGDRLPWLKRVANLDKKYSVRLFHKAWHQEYTKVLNQSKIVFNRSIKGEMNQRAFEAISCGALLFMEEENLEIRDFFTPGTDCVLYNDDNFETLLEYYLSHEEERAEMARKGLAKSREFSFPLMFDKMVDAIAKNLVANKKRITKTFYSCSLQCSDFIQTSLAMRGRGNSTVKNITMLISENKADPVFLNDCAVILMTYAEDLRRIGEANEYEKLSSNALALLSAASKTPNYITSEFNKGQMSFLIGNFQEAGDIFKRLLSIHSIDSYSQCKGLPFPLDYTLPLRFEWNMSISNALGDGKAMAQKRLDCIRFFSACGLGKISLCQHPPDLFAAQAWFEKASAIAPDNCAALVPLAQIYIQKKDPLALEIAQKVLKINPFDFAFWKEWALYLVQTGKQDAAERFVGSCLICLDRLQFATEEVKTVFQELVANTNLLSK